MGVHAEGGFQGLRSGAGQEWDLLRPLVPKKQRIVLVARRKSVERGSFCDKGFKNEEGREYAA